MKKILFFLLTLHQTTLAQSPPNILWIVCEDISPTLSMYGDSTAKTPNLDALAAESMVYENAFAPVGVCAPARSSIITGMSPTSIGTMQMRTGKDIQSWGKREYRERIEAVDLAGDSLRDYAAVLPTEVKCFTEYLRAAGYFCTNNQKTDYQFAAPLTAWDENSPKAHWRNRPEGTPFFSVFNIGTTHESRLWKNEDKPLTVRPEDVLVPPYLPDTEATRRTIARHYSNVELMDAEVGEFLRQLKADGLYENTIVFFYSDHGGPLPRQKREIYDSGLKVPFMVKGISKKEKGRTDRLVSFVDLAPTILSLAGIEPPEHMEGQAFLGKYEAAPRQYVFGSSDRFDEYTDRIRSVRDGRFLYVRNFFPDLPKYKDVGYRKNIPMMENFLEMRDEGRLDDFQKIWFDTKATEELYDCHADPHNLHNLADDPAHAAQLERLRTALWQKMSSRADLGFLPEATMIDMMWPDGKQPMTATPEVEMRDGKVHLKCATEGASIAYRFADLSLWEGAGEKVDFNAGWKLYTGPFPMEKGKHLYIVAERIGYRISAQTSAGF